MIHHATNAAALRANITLTENADERTIRADTGTIVHVGLPEEKAKDVLADAIALRTIRTEFNELKPTRVDEGVWIVQFDDVAFSAARLADLLEQVQTHAEENGVDIENPEDEAEEAEEGEGDEANSNGSVVKPKYRAEYKARGNAAHCSDWLAIQLAEFCTRKEGFDLAFFTAICDANDVDHSKFNVSKPSDRGRLRMSCGLMLRKRVALSGVLVIPATGDADDLELQVPAAYREAWAPKPKEAGKRSTKKAA